MNFRNAALLFSTLIFFTCTKDVGKLPKNTELAKNSNTTKEITSPFSGKYKVNVNVYEDFRTSIGLMWTADSTFTDTMHVLVDQTTHGLTFNYLYRISNYGMSRYSKTYTVNSSGKYIGQLSPVDYFVFRNDSLYCYISAVQNRSWYQLNITGKKIN
jgi:hypothetical protein